MDVEYVLHVLYVIILIAICVLMIMGLVKVKQTIFNSESLPYEQELEQNLLFRCAQNAVNNDDNDHSYKDCILGVKDYLDNQ